MLSKLGNEEVACLLGPDLHSITPFTPTLEKLLEQPVQVRREGFAFDFDEHIIGVGAVAVGLSTSQEDYAIDVVGPVWRLNENL